MRIGVVLLSNGIGGTEKRLSTLFRFMARESKHQYYLIAPGKLLKLLADQNILTDDDLELHEISCGASQPIVDRLPVTLYSGFAAWRRGLNRALGDADAVAGTDVLHYALPISYFIAAPKYRRLAVVEAMASTHEWHIERMLCRAARAGAIVNCLSEPIQRSLGEKLDARAAARLHLSPGSLLDFSDIPAPTPKTRLVVFVGRLESIKNPLLFVDAVAALARRTQDFRAVILGDGRLAAQVDRRIRRLAVGHLVQRSFHHNPREVLAGSQVFVSLQAMDNYPSQALLEAMACGCATVASDVGTTRKLVTPETGLLVPFAPEAIADAIFTLLSSPDVAARMGNAAREVVRRNHSVHRYAAYVEHLYEVAAASRCCDRLGFA